MTVHAKTSGKRRLLAALGCIWIGSAVAQPGLDPPHPADPAAPVPPVTAPESLRGDAGRGLAAVDAPRLPWTRLYHPDGSFVAEETLSWGNPGEAPSTARATPGHDHGTSSGAGSASPSAGRDVASGAAGSAAADARGVVRAVDREQGKVTLKHGPIPRLEMPGMTMVFRVRDASALNGLAPGDEVGFDVEVDGTTFYVTRFSR